MFNRFGVGFGGGSAFAFQNESNGTVWVDTVDLMLDGNIGSDPYYKQIKYFDAGQFEHLRTSLNKATFFTMWLTQGWKPSWFDVEKINLAIRNGKIPVFVYWYFGDRLAEKMPDAEAIKRYHEDTQKLRKFLDTVKGFKILIMEPEFNKASVLAHSKAFVSLMSDAIDILKTTDTAISLCMTDTGNRGENQTWEKCGYDHCALGDQYEWQKPKAIYEALLPKLDFISFQEMLGAFSRDPDNPGTWDNPHPRSYMDDEIGIAYLPQRIKNFTEYLFALYKKPVFLPYITIATATWQDRNGNGAIETEEINKTGYEVQADRFYRKMDREVLKSAHLFGYSVMSLFDDPQHDSGGYQFFLNNEYHLGIIKSSAADAVDPAASGDIVFKGDILKSLFE
jgi:hypothetical protein